MYRATTQFQKIIQHTSRKISWSGILILRDGEKINFTDKDILKGSGFIHRSCSGSSELEIGSVYASECGLSLLIPVNRYRLEGSQIMLNFHLHYKGGYQESIPMGIFDITEANRTKKRIEIRGFDYMLRFNRSFKIKETFGTAYEFLKIICNRCRVHLGMTEEAITSLPNGEELLSIYQDNDIETYRDLLHYVASILGCVAQINRSGQLVLVQYGEQPVTTIKSIHRFESNISDFKTFYTAISSTNVRTKVAEYYALENDSGLTMNLGNNPLMQLGLQTKREKMCQNLLEAISKISYTPFESTTIGNPCLDPGDMIEQIVDGESIRGIITSIEYKINGKHRISGVGKNPQYARAKSKQDKNLIGILNQIQSDQLSYRIYTNLKSFELTKEDIPVIQYEFASDKETQGVFNACILLDVETERVKYVEHVSLKLLKDNESEKKEGVKYELIREREKPLQVIVSYVFNDEKIKQHVPVETYFHGRHVLNLFFPFDKLQEKTLNSFAVLMRLDSGKVFIDKEHILASISGQSLGTTEVWDGKIMATDLWESIPLVNNNLLSLKIQDKLQLSMTQSRATQFREGIERINPGGIRLRNSRDEVLMEVNDV